MIEIQSLSKIYPNFELRNINLEINEGEYFVLLGKSGAGKTLLLELIAGLELPDAGKIFINGINCSKTSIQKRNIGMVFQNYCLFPHMTVHDNIYFSIKKKHQKKTLKSDIEKITNTLNISGLMNRYPSTLSEGESQRVALTRTLVTNPICLLLDEPLSSIDSHLKNEARSLLRKINRGNIYFETKDQFRKKTIIHVTHDYEEALALADKVAVIEDGKISQIGLPQDIFNNPKSSFVARFVGVKNFFKGSVLISNGNFFFEVKQNNLPSSDKIRFCITKNSIEEGQEYVSIRGEDITIANNQIESSARNSFYSTIVDIEKVKTGLEVIVETENSLKFFVLITEQSQKELNLFIGKKIYISFKANAIRLI